MSSILSLRIDVSKIDKSRIYKGKKGQYLDMVVFIKDELDEYGNNGMIVQSVSENERKQGVKGAILGNSKPIGKGSTPQSSNTSAPQAPNLSDDEDDDSLPF
jgi:hypothetical protein